MISLVFKRGYHYDSSLSFLRFFPIDEISYWYIKGVYCRTHTYVHVLPCFRPFLFGKTSSWVLFCILRKLLSFFRDYISEKIHTLISASKNVSMEISDVPLSSGDIQCLDELHQSSATTNTNYAAEHMSRCCKTVSSFTAHLTWKNPLCSRYPFRSFCL